MPLFQKLALAVILLAGFLPGSANALDFCADLWFTRNAIMDRAGYCFGSTLGQSLFDNSGCKGQQVQLSPELSETVAYLRRLEAQAGCRIDTSSPFLALEDLAFRRRLTDLPLLDPDFLGAGCIGWQGPDLALQAGYTRNAPVIGQIRSGNWFSMQHINPDGWSYVIVGQSAYEPVISAGWVKYEGSLMEQMDVLCREVAG
jgi:hypothetical protein